MMDENEFKTSLRKMDIESLNKRVERWKQLVPATYNKPLPDLLWEYLTEADDMYIRGHDIGVILLCAATIELVLADQLKSKLVISKKELERFGLDQMVILCSHIGILSNEERDQINELRIIRNALIHANAGKLNKMAKKQYDVRGLGADDVVAILYIASIGDKGINQDAMIHMKFVRDITVRLYGVNE